MDAEPAADSQPQALATPTGPFEGLLGLEMTELSDALARGHLTVREELKQPAGLIHGGVYAAIAESLASWATALALAPEGKETVGLANQTSFLRPVTHGTIHAVALRKHRGRSTWVWEVEMSDDKGRLCALTRMTMAVRDP
jgi:1,4-dihydroxy-2-naphthoyl-CoA hydrolase